MDGLKTGANYTLTVYTANGHLRSQPVAGSKFTLPLPPKDPKITYFNKSHITLKWTAPTNALQTAQYDVHVRTDFWGHSWNRQVGSNNSFTFDGLKAGTKYDFEVRTKAGGLISEPVGISQQTERREISLSMLCSSERALLCDSDGMREVMFLRLSTFFSNRLNDSVFWELKY
ncbi:fibronectin-like isoform X2 [Centroberyx gerrardi]